MPIHGLAIGHRGQRRVCFGIIPVLLSGLLFAPGVSTEEEVLSEVELQWLAERGPLRLCVDPAWMPFESITPDGEYLGMGADFLALFQERAPLAVELVRTQNWSETLERAEAGDCDVLPLVMATDERRRFLRFTDPYLITPSVIATASEQPFVGELIDVADQPLGIMRDFSFVEIYRETHPGIPLVEVDSYQEGLARVESGELFGMLGNMAGIGYALQQSRSNRVKIGGRISGDSQLSVATRRDSPILHAIFSKLVASLTPAERQSVVGRWYAVRYDMGYDYRSLRNLGIIALLGALLAIYWTWRLRGLNRQLRVANQGLVELNRKDTLTGIFNRQHLDATLQHAVGVCRRTGTELSVAMIDIDHFKSLNDRYGHAFGDQCLRQMGVTMQGMFQREAETVGRYGGEEFMIISEGGERGRFLRQLERFRQLVADQSVHFGNQTTRLSVSIGIWSAVPREEDDALAFLVAADRALYKAKRGGRNRLVHSRPGATGEIRRSASSSVHPDT